jgi:TRAP-type C4-dicarboxylate transport system substrate-binding protein
MFTTAPSNIMSKMAINNLEEIKGVPLRASGGATEILKAWGANPVGMPMPETPEALQKGVVKGLFTSLEVMKDFKFAELCKFVTMTDAAVYPFAVVMNMDKWNSLPDDVKKVFDELAPEQCEWTGKYMDDHVTNAMEWSKENEKVQVIHLDKDQKAAWDKLLMPITDQWVKDAGAKGLPAQALVNDIKELTQKHSGK